MFLLIIDCGPKEYEKQVAMDPIRLSEWKVLETIHDNHHVLIDMCLTHACTFDQVRKILASGAVSNCES